MSLRFRLYGWFFDRPGLVVRWMATNAIILLAAALFTVLLDLAWGSLDMRWGLTVWFSFVLGFRAMVIFNVVANLMGLGYAHSQGKPRVRRS